MNLPYNWTGMKQEFIPTHSWRVDYHGTSGPLNVDDRMVEPLEDTFIKAAQELGFKYLDVNGPVQEGDLTVTGWQDNTRGCYQM